MRKPNILGVHIYLQLITRTKVQNCHRSFTPIQVDKAQLSSTATNHFFKKTKRYKFLFFSHIFLDLAMFPLKIHYNPCHSIIHISFIEDPIPSPLPEARNSISLFHPASEIHIFFSLSLRKCPQPSYPLTFFPTKNFLFLKPSLFLFFHPFLIKEK